MFDGGFSGFGVGPTSGMPMWWRVRSPSWWHTRQYSLYLADLMNDSSYCLRALVVSFLLYCMVCSIFMARGLWIMVGVLFRRVEGTHFTCPT